MNKRESSKHRVENAVESATSPGSWPQSMDKTMDTLIVIHHVDADERKLDSFEPSSTMTVEYAAWV